MDQAPAKEAAVEKTRKCEGADCDEDAGSLQCPTCQKLGKESFFCSQDCFKRNWVGQFHKTLSIYRRLLAMHDADVHIEYTQTSA